MRGRNFLIKSVALMCTGLGLCFLSIPGSAKASEVSGSASLGIYSKYVFRGYELSKNSIVIQPSTDLSYKGFDVNFWGNIDTDEHATNAFTPDRPGQKSFNEVDMTLSYNSKYKNFDYSIGYIYYNTKYAEETEEIFASVTYDTFLSPTLSIYRDIASYPGFYINLSVSKSFSIYPKTSLDLSASVGYYSQTGYHAFHDGMISVGLTYDLYKNVTVEPSLEYSFALSSKAKDAGVGSTIVGGINLGFSF